MPKTKLYLLLTAKMINAVKTDNKFCYSQVNGLSEEESIECEVEPVWISLNYKYSKSYLYVNGDFGKFTYA